MTLGSRGPSYLLRTTVGRYAQAALDASRSPFFRARIDDARRRAAGADRAGYSRTTGPLTNYTLPELERMLAENHAQADAAPRDRRYARDTDPPASSGLDHVSRHIQRVKEIARDHLYRDELGAAVHDLVRREGYLVEIPPEVEEPPANVGSTASAVAAHIVRLPSWGSGTAANGAAYRRARPGQPPLTAEAYGRAYEEALERLRRERA